MNKRNKRRYSEKELQSFERAKGIALPGAYRDYLMRAGAGSKVSLLEEWCQPYDEQEMPVDFLAREFPYTEAWNDLTTRPRELGWNAPYFDRTRFQGAVRMVNLGCESYLLLVVTGRERGNVWRDDRASSGGGIAPLLSWTKKRVTVERYLRRCF